VTPDHGRAADYDIQLRQNGKLVTAESCDEVAVAQASRLIFRRHALWRRRRSPVGRDRRRHLRTRDRISVFEGAGVAGGDTIDLSAIDANTKVTGDRSFAWLGHSDLTST